MGKARLRVARRAARGHAQRRGAAALWPTTCHVPVFELEKLQIFE
jgi:hypothetical protein